MKIACFTFTESGEKIAIRIKESLNYSFDIIGKKEIKISIRDEVEKAFKEYDGIVFVSSTGIAVRLIGPYIKSKDIDPAVIVVDDIGRYSISLLSGHLGGANELAEEIGSAIHALPIVTTASDSRGIEAVDMFAKRHGLFIESLEDAKIITSLMVNGKHIKLISEIPISIRYNNLTEENPDGYIIVSSRADISMDKPCCVLRPKNLNIGIGCKRGKSKEEILRAIYRVFSENELSLRSVKMAGSIDVKKDEVGIIEALKELKVGFKTFKGDEIRKVEDNFKGSDFVMRSVGVSSVSEACAYLLGGNIIVGKTAINGVTVAVSKED